jgi:hypothetical protein
VPSRVRIALALLLAAPGALAATSIDSLTVEPNPAMLAGSTPQLVEIAVTLNRGQFDRQSCDVVIEPGDGGKPLLLTFARGDQRKSLRYTYSQPGAYEVKAIAGTGCSGTRRVNLEVRGPNDPQPVAAAASPRASSMPVESGCPAGWYLVADSVQGARFECRPNLPASPLRCAAGTRYFAENGVIGCR